MVKHLRKWLPEIGITSVLLFFCIRELGTFPAPWIDDSLFMIVAKELAAGHGYVLPVLGEGWEFPFILNVGPQIIVPSAVMIKYFGWSAALARVPSVLYLIVTTFVFYFYTKKVAGRATAQWSTLLLVTLSAFINTGKPVLGEIPGFLFLVLGLLVLHHKKYIGAGILFGLSVMTKLTYGLIYPAIGVAILIALLKKDWKEVMNTTLVGLIAGLTFLPWRLLESVHHAGFAGELSQYAIGWDNLPYLNMIVSKPEFLLRMPFLYFGVLLLLGGYGLYQKKRIFSLTEISIIITLISLFMIYFLNGYGWYRHLLPAHLLLLPFVPVGAYAFVQDIKLQLPKSIRNHYVSALLGFFVLAQFLYQFDHRGASRLTVIDTSVEILERDYKSTKLIVQEPAIFVALHYNPNWKFLTPELQMRTYKEFEHLPLTQEQHCLPIVKRTPDNREELYDTNRLTKLDGSYYLIMPPKSCR